MRPYPRADRARHQIRRAATGQATPAHLAHLTAEKIAHGRPGFPQLCPKCGRTATSATVREGHGFGPTVIALSCAHVFQADETTLRAAHDLTGAA